MREAIKDDLTSGCTMKIHSALGNGFQGVIYQRRLEMEKHRPGFAPGEEIPIYDEGIQVGARRADLLIENEVLVELKAVIQPEEMPLAQGMNDLQAYRIEKGLLINFGAKSLEVKRLFRKSHLTNSLIP